MKEYSLNKSISIEKHTITTPPHQFGHLTKTDLQKIPIAKEIAKTGSSIENPENVPYVNVYFTHAKTDQASKYTNDLDTCQAIVISGENQYGETVSTLLHASPHMTRYASQEDTYKEVLDTFTDKIEGNPSAVIAGGLYEDYRERRYKKEYEDLQHLLVSGVEERLGVTPTIVSPKDSENSILTHIYYATQERRLVVIETESAKSTSFNVLRWLKQR